MKNVLMSLAAILALSGCSSSPDPVDARIEAAIKLCQSDSAKAFSQTQDGFRVMCHDGSSYILRGGVGIERVTELDKVYCSSMGIRNLESDKDGDIKLSCKDGSNYVL
ncbi:hypothetical protein CS022_04140 [Veronia nyctiphanis]|uniref:Lipoprotein n=1 Tax=Veronia nyctiphanis TaxID=1278244 RepID=A0A4Q0YSV0_9GAMM|nr:hypothetical protein [Veronia nyctiphanis]RXJ74256.1 hypothetical protein CS022_04140 [Veronia nyctiphanis]